MFTDRAQVHVADEHGRVSYTVFAQYAHEHVLHMYSQRPEHPSTTQHMTYCLTYTVR